MFPETCAQDHGWYQKDPAQGPERSGRTSIAGALPRAGIGWMEKPVSKPQHEDTPTSNEKARHRKAGDHRSGGHRGTALGGTSGRASESLAHLSRNPGKVLITGHPSLPGGTTLSIAGRSASTPSVGRSGWACSRSTANEDLASSVALDDAMKRSRIFMNRHGKYQWY